MANKKIDKRGKKIKPVADKPTATKTVRLANTTPPPIAKPAATKIGKPANEKNPSKSKPVATKSSKLTNVKKPSISKPAVTKTAKSTSEKKSSTNKLATSKTAKSTDLKKPTKQKADKSILTAKDIIKDSMMKPSQDEAMRLATQTMNSFITSKQEKSMGHFYHTIAKVWQDATTIEKLNTAFAVVLSDGADWNFLKEIWPTLIKDGLSDRGDWVVVGVYPTKPKKLIFDQIFVHEDGEWKLAELKLYTSD